MNKKSTLITVLLAVAVASSSCHRAGTGPSRIVVADADYPTTRLAMRDMSSGDSLIALRLVYHDGFLYAANVAKGTFNLYIHDLENGTGAFHVHKGRGYGELSSIFDLSVDAAGVRLVMLDLLQQKLVAYSLAGLQTGADPAQAEEIRIEQFPVINTFACAGGTIYGAGNIPGVRAFRRTKEGVVDTLATYSPGRRGIEYDRFLAEAYLGRIAVSGDGALLAFACRYADQWELIDLSRGRASIVKGPAGFEPEYEVVPDFGGTLSHKAEERLGYLDVKISGASVYVLYSGARMRGNSGGEEIREFSLSGELLRKYELDEPVLSFDVAPDGRIFAATEDGRILAADCYVAKS